MFAPPPATRGAGVLLAQSASCHSSLASGRHRVARERRAVDPGALHARSRRAGRRHPEPVVPVTRERRRTCVPSAIGEQVPCLPATAHELQLPHDADPQQKPSVQWPLMHSASVAQAVPFALRLVHEPPRQQVAGDAIGVRRAGRLASVRPADVGRAAGRGSAGRTRRRRSCRRPSASTRCTRQRRSSCRSGVDGTRRCRRRCR